MTVSDRFAKQVFKKYKSVDENSSVEFLKYLVKNLPTEIPKTKGTGVVVCGGGNYSASTYVNISMLRHFGVKLPIQIWHLGPSEVMGNLKSVFKHLDVKWVDAFKVAEKHPMRQILKGWPLKTFAQLHCGFKNILFLDADCCPVRNPTFLFDTKEYQDTGLLLWADPLTWIQNDNWKALTGLGSLKQLFPEKRPTKIGYWEVESGEAVINMDKSFRLLLLQRMINEYSDFYFQYFFGDKVTMQMSLGLLNHPCTGVDNFKYFPEFGISYRWLDNKPIFEHATEMKYKPNMIPVRTEFKFLNLHQKFLRQFAAKYRWGEVPEKMWNYRNHGK